MSLQKAGIGSILFPQSTLLASFIIVCHLCIMMIGIVDADGSFHYGGLALSTLFTLLH